MMHFALTNFPPFVNFLKLFSSPNSPKTWRKNKLERLPITIFFNGDASARLSLEIGGYYYLAEFVIYLSNTHIIHTNTQTPKNSKIPRIHNLCLYFPLLQWLLRYWHFCDYSLNKNSKICPTPMLPPGLRFWELIYLNLVSHQLFFKPILPKSTLVLTSNIRLARVTTFLGQRQVSQILKAFSTCILLVSTSERIFYRSSELGINTKLLSGKFKPITFPTSIQLIRR